MLSLWSRDNREFCVQQRSFMRHPSCYLWWYYLQNEPLPSGTSQKPDEREYHEDKEGFGRIGGEILFWCCAGILIICLLCCAYTRIFQKAQDKRLCSDKRENASKAPSSPVCKYYSMFSAWLFLSKIYNGIKKKCIQQPYISTCHSGTTAATCSRDQRQEKQFSKLRQEKASNIDNGNSDSWAPVWKADEMQSIPCEVSHKQHPAQKQREAESFWIREQPCGHCKAERLQQWLHQHFIKPSEKNSSLDEDVWQVCPRRRVAAELSS